MVKNPNVITGTDSKTVEEERQAASADQRARMCRARWGEGECRGRNNDKIPAEHRCGGRASDYESTKEGTVHQCQDCLRATIPVEKTMVRVVSLKPDKKVIKRCVCGGCGATLEYVPNDIQSYSGTDYSGGPSFSEWIECPNCHKQVILKSG